MRILLLSIGHFADSPGGVQRFVQDEAIALRDRGDEVWVLAPGKPTQPEHEICEDIHLLRYVPEKVVPWNPARMSGHQKAVRGVLTRHLRRVDAIHGHALLPYVAALDFYSGAVHAAFDVHSPARMEMAIVWRNSGFLRRVTAPAGLRVINAIEKQCLSRSKVVSVKSQFTADCIMRIHGAQIGGLVRVIPGWADASRFVPVQDRNGAKQQLGWPAGVPVLFTLRRLVPRMGLHQLLEAAHLVRSKGIDFHLMIGGHGPLRAELDQQAARLGLKNRLTFLGRLDDAILPLAYGACDAFVLPTAELECFGIIAVEALLAGRPVLATPVGAIPEIINRFEPAWLARSASPGDIAALICSYLKGQLPEHAPEDLRQRARDWYALDSVLPVYLEALLVGEACAEPVAPAD